MFLFYTWILYHGVSFREDETFAIGFDRFRPDNIVYTTPDPAAVGEIAAAMFAGGGLIGGILGLLFGIVIYIVFAAVLAALLWLCSNVFLVGVPMLSLPLFSIFKRSVFFVIRHVEKCRGRLGSSIKYATGYSLLKSITLYLIVYGAHLLHIGIKSLVGWEVLGVKPLKA